MAMGQGIKTSLAQICAEQLGVPLEQIEVTAGDSGAHPGRASAASPAGSRSSAALVGARRRRWRCARRRSRRRRKLLEARRGRSRAGGRRACVVKGVPGTRHLARRHLAQAARRARVRAARRRDARPGGRRQLPAATCRPSPTASTPARWRSTRAPAHVRHPALRRRAGQRPADQPADRRGPGPRRHGARHRQRALRVDALRRAGQPITTTFADYLLPTATEVPNIEVLFVETPSTDQSARREGHRRGGDDPGRRRPSSRRSRTRSSRSACASTRRRSRPVRVLELIHNPRPERKPA